MSMLTYTFALRRMHTQAVPVFFQLREKKISMLELTFSLALQPLSLPSFVFLQSPMGLTVLCQLRSRFSPVKDTIP